MGKASGYGRMGLLALVVSCAAAEPSGRGLEARFDPATGCCLLRGEADLPDGAILGVRITRPVPSGGGEVLVHSSSFLVRNGRFEVQVLIPPPAIPVVHVVRVSVLPRQPRALQGLPALGLWVERGAEVAFGTPVDAAQAALNACEEGTRRWRILSAWHEAISGFRDGLGRCDSMEEAAGFCARWGAEEADFMRAFERSAFDPAGAAAWLPESSGIADGIAAMQSQWQQLLRLPNEPGGEKILAGLPVREPEVVEAGLRRHLANAQTALLRETLAAASDTAAGLLEDTPSGRGTILLAQWAVWLEGHPLREGSHPAVGIAPDVVPLEEAAQTIRAIVDSVGSPTEEARRSAASRLRILAAAGAAGERGAEPPR